MKRKHIYIEQVFASPVGNEVECDLCHREYTKKDKASGGFIFCGYACCPVCAPKTRAELAKEGDTHLIEHVCPPGVSFYDWILAGRGANPENRGYTITEKEENE